MNNPIHDDIKKLNELLCNVSLPDVFTFPGKERAELAVKLIKEEVEETIVALKEYNLKEIYDGFADSRVVIYGAAVWFGVNLDESAKDYEFVVNTPSDLHGMKKELCASSAEELRLTMLDFVEAMSSLQDIEYFSTVKATVSFFLAKTLSIVNGIYENLLSEKAIPYAPMKELDDIVHSSNMSKLCKSEDDAIKGCNKYRAKEVEVYYEKHNTEPYWTIYRMDGKFLKGPDFKEPDFSKFITE